MQWVTLKMLGSRAAPAAQPFKGAEAKHLVPFVIELLAMFRPPGSAELLTAGVALARLINLLDKSPLNMTAEQMRATRESGVRFLREGIRGGMSAIAKVHQMLHVLHDALSLHGNPKSYNCFSMRV